MAFRGELFGQQPGYRPISGPRMQADGVGFGGGTPREPGKPGQPGGDPVQLPGREPLRQLPAPKGDGVRPPSQPAQQREVAESVPAEQTRDAQEHGVSAPLTREQEIKALVDQGYSAEEATRLLSLSERLTTSPEARKAEEVLRRHRFGRKLVKDGVLSEGLRDGERVKVTGSSIDEVAQSVADLWQARDVEETQAVARQVAERKAARAAQPAQAEQLTLEDKRAAYQQWLADNGLPSDPMNQK